VKHGRAVATGKHTHSQINTEEKKTAKKGNKEEDSKKYINTFEFPL
jgi:hypothetical protein